MRILHSLTYYRPNVSGLTIYVERIAGQLVERGHDPSVVGVAELYAPIASTLVIDTVDAHHAEAVIATGIRCVVTDTVMSTPAITRQLAIDTLASVLAMPR